MGGRTQRWRSPEGGCDAPRRGSAAAATSKAAVAQPPTVSWPPELNSWPFDGGESRLLAALLAPVAYACSQPWAGGPRWLVVVRQ